MRVTTEHLWWSNVANTTSSTTMYKYFGISRRLEGFLTSKNVSNCFLDVMLARVWCDDSCGRRDKLYKVGVIFVAVTLLEYLTVGCVDNESSQGRRFQIEPWFYRLLPELQGLDMLQVGFYLFYAVIFCVHVM